MRVKQARDRGTGDRREGGDMFGFGPSFPHKQQKATEADCQVGSRVFRLPPYAGWFRDERPRRPGLGLKEGSAGFLEENTLKE